MPYDPEKHGPKRLVGPGFREQVRALVRDVPAGWVTTYGDLGEALGSRRIARQVGFALAAGTSEDDFPWHRVVSSSGRVSRRADGAPSEEQIARLLAEGLEVSETGRVRNFASSRLPVELLRPQP